MTYIYYLGCKQGSSDSSTNTFLSRFSRVEVEANDPHQITVTTVFLCKRAKNSKSDRTCGKVEIVEPTGELAGPKFTPYTGECPACVAAARAVHKACHPIYYVRYPEQAQSRAGCLHI